MAGKNTLPDIYVQLPEGVQRSRVSADISGKARVPVI